MTINPQKFRNIIIFIFVLFLFFSAVDKHVFACDDCSGRNPGDTWTSNGTTYECRSCSATDCTPADGFGPQRCTRQNSSLCDGTCALGSDDKYTSVVGGGPTPTPRPCGDCIDVGCGIHAMFIDESKKFAENSCKLNEVSSAENQENPSSLSVAEPEQNKVVVDEIFAGIIDKSNKTSPLASLQVLIDQIMQKTFSILKIFTQFFSKLSVS